MGLAGGLHHEILDLVMVLPNGRRNAAYLVDLSFGAMYDEGGSRMPPRQVVNLIGEVSKTSKISQALSAGILVQQTRGSPDRDDMTCYKELYPRQSLLTGSWSDTQPVSSFFPSESCEPQAEAPESGLPVLLRHCPHLTCLALGCTERVSEGPRQLATMPDGDG